MANPGHIDGDLPVGADPFAPDDGNSAAALFQHARDFELLIAAVMTRWGYSVTDLAGQGDHGADLMAEKDAMRRVVQVKCSTRAIRIRAVRQALFALHTYNADGAIVVSNSQFTTQARQLARARGVMLVDGTRLRGAMSTTELGELHRIDQVAQANAPLIAALP